MAQLKRTGEIMKNVVVCVDLNQNSLDTLKSIRKNLEFTNTMVHFIHVVEINIYNADIIPAFYPNEELHPEIEKSTLRILDKLVKDIGAASDQVKQLCFFSHSREEKITSYLEEVEADLVVVATRGKHGIKGLFAAGSLTDFLCKYSPCDILVLRPKKPLS